MMEHLAVIVVVFGLVLLPKTVLARLLMTVADMLAEMQTLRPDSTSRLRRERYEVGQIVRIKEMRPDFVRKGIR